MPVARFPSGGVRGIIRRVLAGLPKCRASDWLWCIANFWVAHGRFPNARSGLLNDYNFFLKLSPEIEDALRQFCSDKIYAKHFINQIVGREATPKTLAVFDNPEDVTIANLPPVCMVKPAHLGGLFFYHDTRASVLTEPELSLLRWSLRQNKYDWHRERNYRNLRGRIICEELVFGPDDDGTEQPFPTVFRVHCYAGEPRLILMAGGRIPNITRNVYTAAWERVNVTHGKSRGAWKPRPERLDQMMEDARRIAAHFRNIRVDFIQGKDRDYIGELTNCCEQGHTRYGSPAEERLFSELLFGSLEEGRRAIRAIRAHKPRSDDISRLKSFGIPPIFKRR